MEDNNNKKKINNGEDEGCKQKGGKGEGKVPDILDEVKRVEAITKRYLLIQSLGQIKTIAHEIHQMKARSIALLSETGLSSEDSKRVIDFVNNLSTVKLSEEDTEKAKKWAKDIVQGKQKKIEEEIQKITINGDIGLGSPSPFSNLLVTSNLSTKSISSNQNTGNGNMLQQFQTFTNSNGVEGDGDAIVLCDNSNGSHELKIKI